MKRIGIFILPLAVFLASCSKEGTQPAMINEAEWLNKETGYVVYSSFQCDYYVVETERGYALMRNWGGFPPVRGAVLYGSFTRFGVQTFYNRSERYLMNADIRDLSYSYFQAIDQANRYCGQGVGFNKAADAAPAAEDKGH